MSTEKDDPEQSGNPAADAGGAAPTSKNEAAQPDDAAATPEGERIAKAIARAGIASRRDAEALIEAGRVSLNGQVLTSPAINVTEADRIVVDGEPLPARERTRLWLLHKPRGVVTTARDPQGRQTVFEILPDDLPRVVAIGRLDINTEGLLLLTNDGGLAKVIAHPDTGWLRRYRVRAYGDVTQPDLDKLRKGVTIDGMEYGPVEATLDRAQGDNVWLTLGLREGKNREVKRILEHLGLSVNRLIRLSFGPFQLGDLEIGLVEEIRTKVLKEQLGKTLAEEAGVDFTSPVREPIAPFGKPDRGPPQAAARPPRAQRPERAPSARTPGRPSRDPARPGTAGRAAGADRAKPERRTTWHAEDALKRSGTPRIPRRGADPKQARATAAERGRERVGAIRTGERRVVVERLQPTPVAEPPRSRPPRERDEARPRRSSGDAPMRGPRSEDRGGPARSGERRPSRPAGPERVAERPERGGFRPRREGPAQDGPPRARGERRPGGFGDGERSDAAPRRPRAPREDGPPRNERAPGGFKGGRPGGKPGGGRPGGARGGDSFGKRPGGAGGGGRPGGRPSGGGGKPGGGRPGGGKPGGRPGGSGGRPPRAGR